MTRKTVQLVSKHIFLQNFQGLIHHLHISQNEMKIKGYAKIFFFGGGGEGGQTRCIMGDVQMGNGLKLIQLDKELPFA